jgi:histidine triad (HIT) family protein
MTTDFYCDEVLSGNTEVTKVIETERVLAFHHTRPSYPVHIVVIPRQHVDSLLTLDDDALLVGLMKVVRQVASSVVESHGACRVITNLGYYQDSKHLHWHVISG